MLSSFTDDNTSHEITYSGQLKNVFYGITNSTNVIVKFVAQYCKEALVIMAKENLAPKLLCYQKVTSRFYMVVMEYIRSKCQAAHNVQVMN